MRNFVEKTLSCCLLNHASIYFNVNQRKFSAAVTNEVDARFLRVEDLRNKI